MVEWNVYPTPTLKTPFTLVVPLHPQTTHPVVLCWQNRNVRALFALSAVLYGPVIDVRWILGKQFTL